MQALLRALAERSSNARRNAARARSPAALAYARKHGLHALVIARGDDVVAQEFGEGFEAATSARALQRNQEFLGCRCAVRVRRRIDRARRAGRPRRSPLGATIRGSGASRCECCSRSRRASVSAAWARAFRPTNGRSRWRCATSPERASPTAAFRCRSSARFSRANSRRESSRRTSTCASAFSTARGCASRAGASWRTERSRCRPARFSQRAIGWPTGASSPRERSALAPCFEGSAANARYGLGWWLGARGAPSDLVYASGSAGQALYLVPSLDVTIVHFGKSSSYRHETFFKRVFRASNWGGSPPVTGIVAAHEMLRRSLRRALRPRDRACGLLDNRCRTCRAVPHCARSTVPAPARSSTSSTSFKRIAASIISSRAIPARTRASKARTRRGKR